jgi:hypothetical protein
LPYALSSLIFFSPYLFSPFSYFFFTAWINNCVGYFNRRFFILFLFWTGVGLLSYFFIVLEHVIKILFVRKFRHLPPLPPEISLPFSIWLFLSLSLSFPYAHLQKLPMPPNQPLPTWLVIGSWFYSAGLTFAVNFLFGINIYLIGSGQTSIEWAQVHHFRFLISLLLSPPIFSPCLIPRAI